MNTFDGRFLAPFWRSTLRNKTSKPLLFADESAHHSEASETSSLASAASTASGSILQPQNKSVSERKDIKLAETISATTPNSTTAKLLKVMPKNVRGAKMTPEGISRVDLTQENDDDSLNEAESNAASTEDDETIAASKSQSTKAAAVTTTPTDTDVV